MQEQRAVRLEQAVHFQQAHGLEAHERAHARAMGVPGALDRFHEAGLVVLEAVDPFLVEVLPSPAVLELGALGQAFGRGVEIPAFVERRVSGDEIDGPARHDAHEVQVLAVEQGAVGPVGPGASLAASCSRLLAWHGVDGDGDC